MTGKQVSIGLSAFALLQGMAFAQHVHQPVTAQAPAAPLASCAQVQPAVENIIAEAMRRLEGARQANDPAQMRAAVDHSASALRDIRTQLAPCAAPAAADAHAGHAMPKADPPAAAIAAPAKPAAVADPHAGHQMPPAKPAPAPPARPGAVAPKPKATTTKAPTPKAPTPKAPAKAADPHAAHTEPAEPKKEMDPVNGLTVDPSTAPKTTHQGRTYYFSSEQSLKEFLANPAKFVKPPKK